MGLSPVVQTRGVWASSMTENQAIRWHCQRCNQGQLLCKGCFRNQRFCSSCAKQQRRESSRRSQARYRHSRRGRHIKAAQKKRSRERIRKTLSLSENGGHPNSPQPPLHQSLPTLPPDEATVVFPQELTHETVSPKTSTAPHPAPTVGATNDSKHRCHRCRCTLSRGVIRSDTFRLRQRMARASKTKRPPRHTVMHL